VNFSLFSFGAEDPGLEIAANLAERVAHLSQAVEDRIQHDLLRMDLHEHVSSVYYGLN
jgi:hypothetical protein